MTKLLTGLNDALYEILAWVVLLPKTCCASFVTRSGSCRLSILVDTKLLKDLEAGPLAPYKS